MSIRLATPLDALALSTFAGRMFRGTYAAHIPHEDLEAHVHTDLSPEAFSAFLGDPDMAVLVAEDAGELTGYAHLALRPCLVEPQPGDVDLCRFYVDVPHHGTGLAHLLLAEVRHWAQGRGRLWLQAWTENGRALAFYRKSGFREVGETTFTVGTQVYRDLVLLDVTEP